MVGQAERGRHRSPVHVRRLGRDVHGERLTAVVPVGDNRPPLQRHPSVAVGSIGSRHHQVGRGEGIVHVTGVEHPADQHVVWRGIVDGSDAGAVGCDRVDVGGELVVVDRHQLRRVLSHVPVDGHHHRHRLTLEADLVGGQEWLGGLDVAWQRRGGGERQAGQVGVDAGGDRQNPIERLGLGSVDRSDATVGDRAPYERCVNETVQADVGHEPAAAGEEPGVFLADDPFTERAAGGSGYRLAVTHGSLPFSLDCRSQHRVPTVDRHGPGR